MSGQNGIWLTSLNWGPHSTGTPALLHSDAVRYLGPPGVTGWPAGRGQPQPHLNWSPDRSLLMASWRPRRSRHMITGIAMMQMLVQMLRFCTGQERRGDRKEVDGGGGC